MQNSQESGSLTKKGMAYSKIQCWQVQEHRWRVSRVSINSLKIGPIAKNGKPQVSNDVVHDPRIRYPEWAKKEKLKSFAGYPLMYKDQSVGVLAIFSEKRFSPADFELLGIFCDQLSKKLVGFFEA